MTHTGPQESAIKSSVRNCPPETVQAVRDMHEDWLRDFEIGERLGLESLRIWHIRQHFKIDRHRDALARSGPLRYTD